MRIVYPSATITHYASNAGGITTSVQTGVGIVAGEMIDITPPDFPFSFEKSINAVDRETLGGRVYSKIRNTRREGIANFSNVPEFELTDWRAWYSSSQGFRQTFAMEEPVSGAVYLCKAPGQFPLVRDRFERWNGRMRIIESL